MLLSLVMPLDTLLLQLCKAQYFFQSPFRTLRLRGGVSLVLGVV